MKKSITQKYLAKTENIISSCFIIKNIKLLCCGIKDRVIIGCFMIKDRVIKTCFMIKDRVANLKNFS